MAGSTSVVAQQQTRSAALGEEEEEEVIHTAIDLQTEASISRTCLPILLQFNMGVHGSTASTKEPGLLVYP